MLGRLTKRLSNAFETYVTRPVFFAIVLPPLLVMDWWHKHKAEQQAFIENLNKPLRSEDELRRCEEMLREEIQSYFSDTPRFESAAPLSDSWIGACFACGERHAYHECPQLRAIREGMTAEDWQPTNIHEALIWIDSQLDDESKREFKRVKEDDVFKFHHSLGRQIRNALKLWEDPKPPLWHYFDSIAIRHPDDMSGLLMTSLHRYLNERPIELEAQIKKYHDYWGANLP